MKKYIAATCLTVLASTSVAEQGDTPSNKIFDRHEVGVSLHSMSIDSQIAQANNVGEDLYKLNFFWLGRIDNLLVSAGIGLLQYEDYGEYDVRVTNQFGDNSTESAEASGIELNLEMGYRHEVSGFNLDFLAGYSNFNSSRSVDNCSDCPEEDIDIDSGAYVKPRVGYQFGEKWALELSYTNYFSADVSGNVGLEFTFRG